MSDIPPTKVLAVASKIAAVQQSDRLLTDTECGAIGAGYCRAQKRVYIGQARFGGTWHQCRKRPRAGSRTCHWHRHLEDGS